MYYSRATEPSTIIGYPWTQWTLYCILTLQWSWSLDYDNPPLSEVCIVWTLLPLLYRTKCRCLTIILTWGISRRPRDIQQRVVLQHVSPDQVCHWRHRPIPCIVPALAVLPDHGCRSIQSLRPELHPSFLEGIMFYLFLLFITSLLIINS